MAIKFKKQRINIPLGRGRRGNPREFPGSFEFDSRVLSSEIILGGFKFDFKSDDHHINEIEINPVKIGRTPPDPEGNKIFFNLECQYADKNFDDKWSGYIDLIAIADVE